MCVGWKIIPKTGFDCLVERRLRRSDFDLEGIDVDVVLRELRDGLENRSYCGTGKEPK
jgi:hypothetical protein